MSIKLALAGNPNSGKTTLFNRLTGSTQYVGNWPGVTVEKKEGLLKSEPNVVLQDLPGIYSLSPYTPEELITREYLVKERPDAIVNIVDASNIERNLYLTTQLIELGIPVIVALNMIDVVRKNGDNIDVARLSRGLRCPVLEISALKGLGEEELMKEAVALIKAGVCGDPPCFYSGATEHALAHIEDMLCHVIEDDLHGEEHHHTHHHHTADGYLVQDVPVEELRWYAVKLFERDPHIIKEMALDEATLARLEEIIQACEKEQEEDAEAILIRERYDYIEKLVGECVIKKRSGRSLSEKADMVLSNRWAALPIFALIMFLVYYLSIAGLGGWMADWTNEELFGRILPDALRGRTGRPPGDALAHLADRRRHAGRRRRGAGFPSPANGAFPLSFPAGRLRLYVPRRLSSG